MKIEIGGQRNLPGWINLGVRDNGFDIICDDIPYTNVEYIYWSHVIEHIPFFCISKIFKKFFNALTIGGCVRTVCPDMEAICKAYLNNDISAFDGKKNQWSSFSKEYRECGIGGMFISQFVNSCAANSRDENHLINNKKIGISDFSHIAGYDFNMLKSLLKKAGFTNIERTKLISIDPHQTSGQLCVNAYKNDNIV